MLLTPSITFAHACWTFVCLLIIKFTLFLLILHRKPHYLFLFAQCMRLICSNCRGCDPGGGNGSLMKSPIYELESINQERFVRAPTANRRLHDSEHALGGGPSHALPIANDV